jgi:uncharacterized protein YggU (UPF0235/DUF167 family)
MTETFGHFSSDKDLTVCKVDKVAKSSNYLQLVISNDSRDGKAPRNSTILVSFEKSLRTRRYNLVKLASGATSVTKIYASPPRIQRV